MRQYEMKETKEVKKIFCNKCGREIPRNGNLFEEDVLHVEKRWGYFSGKDNEVHAFDLCETCYDELISSFEIPIEKES